MHNSRTICALATVVAAVCVGCASNDKSSTDFWSDETALEAFRWNETDRFDQPVAQASRSVPVRERVVARPAIASRLERLGNDHAGRVDRAGVVRRVDHTLPADRIPSVVAAEHVVDYHPRNQPELLPPSGATTLRVSDTFVETDVRQAVQSLASQAEATVIIDDQVRGAATAMIDDQPFAVALRQVLLPLGYVHREVDGVYYVGLPDPDSALFDWLTDRYRYTALHRDPQELAGMLATRHAKFVQVSSNGGWIIVEAPPAQATQVIASLEQLDKPIPQVVLEAMICVYSPQASFRFGFDVDAGVRIYDRTTQVALSGLSLAGAVGPIGTAANLNDFRVTGSVLRLLEQRGFVKIRASPRVMALDGQKAQIRIGRESFFSVQPEASDFIYRQDIEQVDSGIVLDIVPAVRDPYVTVRIERAEVSEDIRSDETQANPSDRFPVINRRSVTTTVKVRDGETIVIGGLTQQQQVDYRNKVPGLGDLPGVGKLFQRVEKVNAKAEVAIFISPRILREDCDCERRNEPLELAMRGGPDQLAR